MSFFCLISHYFLKSPGSCHYRVFDTYPILGGDGDCSFNSLGIYSRQLSHCHPEVRGHEEVEDEVGSAVDEGQHVHHLPDRVVTLKEELLPQDADCPKVVVRTQPLCAYAHESPVSMLTEFW